MNRFLHLAANRRIGTLVFMFALSLAASQPAWAASPPVAKVMDELVATLCAGRSAEESADLDDATILAALTPDQRRILATEYWSFDVSTPVVVSIMRDRAQKTPPFWLEEYGFEKTDLTARNEMYTYEVWRKAYPAGRVGLGINGFERHRPHYFVAVGPQQPEETVTITSVVPGPQEIYTFEPGASIYHDWPDLVLTDTPEQLTGGLLLPTIRGRAREAQLIGAFRETLYPASETPDMTVLTWSEDPETTQTIQWRVAEEVETEFRVFYRKKSDTPDNGWLSVVSASVLLEDRNIINNPRVRWHRATLRGLEPGTEYEYAIAEASAAPGLPAAVFRTAPAGDTPFSFLWMSDTHSNTASIPLLQTAWERHPDAAFLTISGDLVGTGQQRDDWDALFANYEDFLQHRSLVPSIGNHDAIDGLGSDLYRSLLWLPDNGPDGFERGKSYSLRYGNLLLVSLDVTSSVSDQTGWLEATLRDSNAHWKVAVLHFPPYALTEEYPEIQEEWGALFDRYHVDLALAGHVHYYMRTWPIRDGVQREAPDAGVTYVVSVAVPGRERVADKPEYAKVLDLTGANTCQAFVVEEDQLTMYAYTADGEILDSFTIEKK